MAISNYGWNKITTLVVRVGTYLDGPNAWIDYEDIIVHNSLTSPGFYEGYNDFYFADDALPNVRAVKDILEQFDVKSKVQQAKLEQYGKFLIDTSTKEGQDIVNQIKNIPTVSSSEFRKAGRWTLETVTKEGKEIAKQMDNIKPLVLVSLKK